MFEKLNNWFHGYFNGGFHEENYHEIMGLKFWKSEDGKKSKALTFLTNTKSQVEECELFLEIRSYMSDKACEDGVFLTEKQYNWMMEKLIESQSQKRRKKYTYDDKESNSMEIYDFKLTPKYFGGYELSQRLRFYPYTFKLSKKDIDILIKDFSTFDKILDVFETILIKPPN